MLGGAKEICAAGTSSDAENFDAAGQIYALLRLQRLNATDSAINSARAVKMVGMGLKRLKQILKTDLYNKLEAEDLKSILYLEVLALYKSHLTEQESSVPPQSPHLGETFSVPEVPKLHPAVSFRGLRGFSSMNKRTSTFSKSSSMKSLMRPGSFKSTMSSADGSLFRPEPHFVSKQEMRGWKSVLQVFAATRQPLLESTDNSHYGSQRLIESLGLKYPNPEKFYRTIYVQPLLIFHVKMSGSIRDVLVPDWLDWDPSTIFYQQVKQCNVSFSWSQHDIG